MCGALEEILEDVSIGKSITAKTGENMEALTPTGRAELSGN